MNFRGNIGIVKSYILAAAVVFVWGVTFVSTKYLLSFLEPGEILFYRVIIAYVAFVAASPKPLPRVSRGVEAKIAASGLLGVTVYFLLENSALMFGTASNVSLLCSIAPLLTGVLSHIFTSREKLSRRFWVGSVFCLVGIFFIVFNGHFILKLNPLGDALALLAATAFASYSVVIRDVKIDLTPAQTARTMLFYALVSLLLLTLTPAITLHARELLRPAVIGNLLFLGLFASGFCTWGWNIVIWNIGAVKANNLIYLSPPLTMLFSVLFLNEKITVFAITGGVLILAGVYVSQKIKNC